MCLALLPKGFDHSRKDGDHNDDNNDEREVFLTMGMFPKKKPSNVIATTQNVPPII
jgi:hypothetical protein